MHKRTVNRWVIKLRVSQATDQEVDEEFKNLVFRLDDGMCAAKDGMLSVPFVSF